jgi:hypothetical protein
MFIYLNLAESELSNLTLSQCTLIAIKSIIYIARF